MINRSVCRILCMIMKRHCDLTVENMQAQCRNSHKHVEKSRYATSEHCCRRGYSSDSCSMLSTPPYARARSTKVNRMRDMHYPLCTVHYATQASATAYARCLGSYPPERPTGSKIVSRCISALLTKNPLASWRHDH
jgi:hypothetical protein